MAAVLGNFILSPGLVPSNLSPRIALSHGEALSSQRRPIGAQAEAPLNSSIFGRCLSLGSFLVAASFGRQVAGGRSGSGRIVVRGRNYETNIKKKKGPAERRQAMITSRYLRMMTLAIKEGGPDQEINRPLKRIISMAVKNSVPRATIDNRIKMMVESKDAFNEIVVSGYAPGGVAVIVECLTDNTNRARMAVREAFKEVGGTVGTDGAVDHCFTKLGVIRFENTTEEAILEASMTADAQVEDAVAKEDGSVEVTTLPENFNAAIKAFEGAGLEPTSTEFMMKNVSDVELSDKGTYQVLHLLHELGECDDVGEVHHNGILKDGVELQISQNNGKVVPVEKVFK
jgi:YebC/PmpR family DNA-binding regulatory protein